MHLPNQFTSVQGCSSLLEALLPDSWEKKSVSLARNKEWLWLFLVKTDYFATLWMCFGGVRCWLLRNKKRNGVTTDPRSRIKGVWFSLSHQILQLTHDSTSSVCKYVLGPVFTAWFCAALTLTSVRKSQIKQKCIKGWSAAEASISVRKSQPWSWQMFSSVTSR